ncbi:TonB-linked SusC/RagA family outer membrane protein [Pedobacter cryoconitis]|uniref:TonB-linked SusC/RagA family outer membrane protein n=1 Tax=Pedobacter cryoconitis TaxID=188932 RepID=A0A7W8ZKW3_9SPHI|nr:SusC/RagA family TonB-linked outer membrane protein [Pedobacter cryoconitis]MBB5635883.1 TonB-linked SusC/RagA family outer membrane protein [Pedobacter cryoconitis]
MKTVVKLLIFFALQITLNAYSQTKVTLKLKSVGFEKIIDAIQNQTSYHFIYSQAQIPTKKITIKVKDKEVFAVLDQLLQGTAFTYKLLENNLIAIRPLAEDRAIRLVKGKITDENSIPIARTSVKVRGTRFSTKTDAKGEFSIPAAPNAILVLSQVGYQHREFPVKENLAVEISLHPLKNDLDEVLITALNIPKEERKIGYAISAIDGYSLTKARESNIVYALEGQVAGLNISGVNGGPGSSARILLRGAASMTAGSPLFVVNGVPIDNTQRGSANEYGGADYGDGISNINPDDVETITVLKGSAASALYGARAANGVILITIKSAGKNSGTAIEYNTNLSFDKAVNNTDFQYVYGQGTQNHRPETVAAAVASGLYSWGEKLDDQPVIQFDGNKYPYSAVKDNIQKFYRTAPAFTNTVSISHGGQKGSIHLSASNLNQQSIIRNGSLDRKTVNLYTTHDLTKKLSVTFNGNYIREYNKNRSYLSDGPLNANYGIAALATNINQAILAPGYNLNTGAETPWNDDEYKTNPYFVLNKQADYSSRNRFISSASAKYKFSDWIYLQARLGYDVSNDNILGVIPTGAAFSVNGEGGINTLKKSRISELNSDFLLAANRNLTQDLKLDVSVGTNFRKRLAESDGLMGSRFIIPYVYTPSNLVTIIKNNTYAKIVTESAYYTADLSYKNYLNLSATGRYDVYSTLPQNNRGIFVPGVSASFVFSDLLKLTGLNYGKLRASFAKTSGEPIQPYTTQTYYYTTSDVNGVPLGNFSRDLPNYNLRPFTLNEFETGINLKMFNNRLFFDLTYFHRITHNEIINAKQSVTSGFTSAYVNLGKTRNSGVEVLLQGIVIDHKNFKWRTGFNISHIDNRLLSIDGSSQYALAGTYRPLNAYTAMVVGKPVTQIMAYDYLRDAKGNIIIGSDGIPVRGDLKPMGSTLPNVYGGFSNNFYYKNFSFSMQIDFKYGNKILSATENYSYVFGLNKATLEGRETGIVAAGVHPDGTINTTNVPAYNYYPQLATNISALSVLNGSFIKLRQVTLGYTIPAHQLKRTPFNSISIDLVSRNLFTLVKYTKNIDPESEFASSLNYAGIEGASFPAVRTFGINVNFKFQPSKK